MCLNSLAATADNSVYLTRIRLGGDGAEKARDRQLTPNTAIRFFVITTQILPRIDFKMKYSYPLLGSIILFIIKKEGCLVWFVFRNILLQKIKYRIFGCTSLYLLIHPQQTRAKENSLIST